MQKLILPIQDMLLTAGYQNAAYRSKFGFAHYGHDSVSMNANRLVYASGNGRVLAAGADSLLGNVLIVVYPQVTCQQDGKVRDIVLRYCHLASIAVKAADTIAVGAPLGVYGNTGRYSAGAHLHVEADFDSKFFAYSATVGKDGTIIKAGNSTTMCSPSGVWCVGTGQRQTASKASFGGVAYVRADDLAKPIA